MTNEVNVTFTKQEIEVIKTNLLSKEWFTEAIMLDGKTEISRNTMALFDKLIAASKEFSAE